MKKRSRVTIAEDEAEVLVAPTSSEAKWDVETKKKRVLPRRTKEEWKWWCWDVLLPILWRLVFALVAICEAFSCWPAAMNGWDHGIDGIEAQHQQHQDHHSIHSIFRFHFFGSHHNNHNVNGTTCDHAGRQDQLHHHGDHHQAACPASATMAGGENFIDSLMLSRRTFFASLFWFCCFCEAILRAREAQQQAYESAALNNLEKTLTRVYSTTRFSVANLQGTLHRVCSTTRFSLRGQLADSDRFSIQQQTQQRRVDSALDAILAQNTLRLWIPVAAVLSFWLWLLPWWAVFQQQQRPGAGAACDEANLALCCASDPSLATIWLTHSLHQLRASMEILQEHAFTILRKLVLPFGIRQPRRLVQRVRLILRWIRYVRFAGPLVRVGLKIVDQVMALTKTWRQQIMMRAERAKRIARRSMLLDDIRRIESLARMQTALASVPSRLFHMAHFQLEASENGVVARVGAVLAEKKQEGRKLKKLLSRLREEVTGNSIASSELYDCVVELTKELTSTVSTAVLSANLIPPNTRFGLGWRMVVTWCLLLELIRLYISWHLSETFDLSITRILSLSLIHYDDEKLNLSQQIGIFFGNVVRSPVARLLGEGTLDWLPSNIDEPSTLAAVLVQHIGYGLESLISIVCFVDIFVWFSTGELNAKGMVVPKPFITRCIIPGTLVQVLDHPTLPDILPLLLTKALGAAYAVGFGRAIRWGMAVVPAIVVLLTPLHSYLFQQVSAPTQPAALESEPSTLFGNMNRSEEEHQPSPASAEKETELLNRSSWSFAYDPSPSSSDLLQSTTTSTTTDTFRTPMTSPSPSWLSDNTTDDDRPRGIDESFSEYDFSYGVEPEDDRH